MKASVIICTYNRAESLRTALQLLEWQTYDDFEVIVVNGPSTDNTKDVLKEYEGKIKVFHNPEKNYIISRNMGANAAAGDILCYIDDDSEPDTPWLANVMHEFEDEQVGAVTGPIDGGKLDANIPVVFNTNFNFKKIPVLFPHYSSPSSDFLPCAQGCNMSIRRSALEKVGGFIEKFVFYHEEPDLCFRLICIGYTIVNVRECSIVHRSVSLPTDKKMRSQEKGLLRPFHALKNMIYLRYIWCKTDEKAEDIKADVENMADIMFNDAKRRFKEDVLTYEEWCHYKEGIALALKWGIEHGTALDLKPPSIAPVKRENFLQFPKRRKAGALVVCLCLWSLADDGGGPGHGYSTLAKNLALRGHEVHVLGRAQGVPTCSFSDHVHWHHLRVDQAITIENSATSSVILNNGIAYLGAVTKLSCSRVVDICLGFIFTSSTLFVSQDISFNSALTLCTTHKTWCKSHPHWKLNDSDLVAKLEELTVNSHNNFHAISSFIVQGVKGDYPDSFKENAEVFHVPIGTLSDQVVANRAHQDRIKILFLSRIEGRKCPEVLFAAFAKVTSKHKNIELVMAGNDTLLAPTGRTYRKDFEAQYLGTDIGAKVHFTGFISEEEKWEEYHKCDIFCMPSLSESFGIPFIEAMACGKPVIGCRAGGMPEVITEGETGLLAEPGDVKTLAACLEQLICDDALRVRMGKAARLRYEQNYTAELYAERMEKEFYRIAGKTAEI